MSGRSGSRGNVVAKSIEDLEREAHELYEKWVKTRADEDYKAWLAVKERLDALKDKEG